MILIKKQMIQKHLSGKEETPFPSSSSPFCKSLTCLLPQSTGIFWLRGRNTSLFLTTLVLHCPQWNLQCFLPQPWALQAWFILAHDLMCRQAPLFAIVGEQSWNVFVISIVLERKNWPQPLECSPPVLPTVFFWLLVLFDGYFCVCFTRRENQWTNKAYQCHV